MDPARSLRNFKADITSSNYTSRVKAQTIYNSAKMDAEDTTNKTNYDGTFVFNDDRSSILTFRSYGLKKELILGNDLCIPPSTEVECGSAPCSQPEYFQTYNSMYTVRDGSYNFIELFGEYGLGKNDLCKANLWKTTGAYIDPSENLPPKFTLNYNIGILDCTNFTKKIKFE